jgi:hypothetical protein
MNSMMNEVEDYLQEQGVFISGLNGRVTHMDSYMTVMDFPTFDKAMENPPFTRDQLLKAAEEIQGFAYLSPMAGLTSLLIQTKLCPAFGPLSTIYYELKKEKSDE